MKLIDVTNSYHDLVNNQLESTDAQYIKVYSLGNTTIVYTEASKHNEIVIINRKRKINDEEIRTVLDRLVSKDTELDDLNYVRSKGLIEISITK